jgi:hypothetical protein
VVDKSKEKELRRKRRLAKEKKKKKAIKLRPWMDEGDAAKLADHLHNCSCDMCRNPRKSKFHKGRGKKTLPEQKFEDIEREFKKEGNWSSGF